MRNGTAIGGPDGEHADFAALRAYVRGLRLRLPLFDVVAPLPRTGLFDAEQGRLTAPSYELFDLAHAVLPTRLPRDGLFGSSPEPAGPEAAGPPASLDREIGDLEGQLGEIVAACGSSLPRLPGIGVLLAAKLLGETGDVRRFRSECAFAAVTGTAPSPASSGQTQRHRLNRGGNRQLNRAVHFIAICSRARILPLRPTWPACRPRAGPGGRHSAASSATSPMCSTEPCHPTCRRPKSGLDEIGAHALGLDRAARCKCLHDAVDGISFRYSAARSGSHAGSRRPLL